MRATPAQREILTIMTHGDDIEDYCYDYPYAVCVGEHRHMQRRTLAALERNGWIALYDPGPQQESTLYWHITEAGRAAVASPKLGGESE